MSARGKDIAPYRQRTSFLEPVRSLNTYKHSFMILNAMMHPRDKFKTYMGEGVFFQGEGETWGMGKAAKLYGRYYRKDSI